MDINSFFNELNNKVGIEPHKSTKSPENLSPQVIVEKKTPAPVKKSVLKPTVKPVSQNIDEEFIEKSLTYTTVILKSIRETFDGDKRHVIYESLYETLGKILGQQPIQHTPIQSQSSMFPNTPVQEQVEMSEEAKEELAIVESNQGYKRDMGIQTTQDGVDLSSVSSQDISDFKTLAGM